MKRIVSENKIRSLVREAIIDSERTKMDRLLEMEFDAIFEGLGMLLESGRWTSPNTYEWDPETKKGTPDQGPVTFEWDFTTSDLQKSGFADDFAKKIKKFVEKLPKEKVVEYFGKFLDKIKSLPRAVRRQIILGAGIAFLGVSTLSALTGPSQHQVDPKMAQEFKEVVQDEQKQSDAQQDHLTTKDSQTVKKKIPTGKSSFNQAQKHVKTAEAGYSDDRHDTGNWIQIKGYGKRFVGSKYGISAPILAKFLGRLPKAEDMRKLSYETALKIYKKNYWDSNNLHHFANQSVATILYDGCVNQGTYGTMESMRNALKRMGVKISDSENPFSAEWIKLANGLDQERLFSSIKAERKQRYKSSETFAVHGKGWMNRLDSIDYDPVS